MTSSTLEMRDVTREYRSGRTRVAVLRGLDLHVAAGERVAVMGASGSGKSTLLHLAGGMDLPDRGRIEVLGRAVQDLPEPERTRYRGRHIGLIFQDYNLLESLTASENIELVLWLNGLTNRRRRLQQLAAELGIGSLLERHPGQLSGGEQQRVAIARALVHEPRLILADEPTGSLDEDSARAVLELLARATARRDCALILVTHSRMAAATCDRVLRLKGGKLVPDGG